MHIHSTLYVKTVHFA